MLKSHYFKVSVPILLSPTSIIPIDSKSFPSTITQGCIFPIPLPYQDKTDRVAQPEKGKRPLFFEFSQQVHRSAPVPLPLSPVPLPLSPVPLL